MTEQPELRPTHVVTNFLLRTDGNEPRILIVRRSQRVGSRRPVRDEVGVRRAG